LAVPEPRTASGLVVAYRGQLITENLAISRRESDIVGLQAHQLAYDIEQLIIRKLRGLKVPRPKAITDDVVPEIMKILPSETFEPAYPWTKGICFFHGDVTEEACVDMQLELSTIHVNIPPALPITMYLSSFGGYAESGMALFSTIQEIRRDGRKVNAHIQGTAMSMGTYLTQACDERTIEPFASFMIHEIHDHLMGKTSDIEDQMAFLKRYEATLNQLYAERSGKPVEYWREKMARRDVYMTAREALNEGLVDKIRKTPPFTKSKRANAKP
jgi:ATP-dependent Clp endopeptidase proteolytic subunit ClpP